MSSGGLQHACLELGMYTGPGIITAASTKVFCSAPTHLSHCVFQRLHAPLQQPRATVHKECTRCSGVGSVGPQLGCTCRCCCCCCYRCLPGARLPPSHSGCPPTATHPVAPGCCQLWAGWVLSCRPRDVVEWSALLLLLPHAAELPPQRCCCWRCWHCGAPASNRSMSDGAGPELPRAPPQSPA